MTAGQGPQVLVRVVTVVTADTPVQGPKVKLPPGTRTSVRMRNHSTVTGRLGYVGFSNQAVSQDSERVEMRSNDTIGVGVLNWEEIWFSGNTATTKFELMAEYAQ